MLAKCPSVQKSDQVHATKEANFFHSPQFEVCDENRQTNSCSHALRMHACQKMFTQNKCKSFTRTVQCRVQEVLEVMHEGGREGDNAVVYV